MSILVEEGRCVVAELEHLMFHPAPADLGPMFSVALVDKRWTILSRRAEGQGLIQVYTPVNYLHPFGHEREAIEAMAEKMNMGLRVIDVIMDHESTYNPRNAEPC